MIVVKASASGAANSGFTTSRVKPMTLKLVFTVFFLDAQRYKISEENMQSSLLVVLLGKASGVASQKFRGGKTS